MSRLKSYYTLAEQELNLYTSGSQFMTQDRKEYIGLYHRYIVTGEIFTNSSYTKTSKELIPFKTESPAVTEYKLLRPNIKTEYITPEPISLKITMDDIKAGSITRHFMKKINSTDIMEVDLDQIKSLSSKKIDPNLYESISINWTITGELNDRMERGIRVVGARSKNMKSIKDASKKFAGLDKKILNPTEYYTDTDFVILRDINSPSTPNSYTSTSSY
tara:strand:- start:67 stop:720 length:654 start_codon:yes stop_codon:yes gene_type:complete